MTASSQNSPGALPPEAPMPDAARAAFAAYGVVLPVPAGSPQATSQPEQAARTVQAATGVIAAAMEHGSGTAREIAQAEQDAGLLYDPQRAQDIAQAAREQGRAEAAAELAQAEQDRETLLWLRERWRAIGQLCEGRPETDLLTVREVLTAADGTPPTGAPLAVTWDGMVMGPSGDTEGENTLVPCTTARGGSAVLVLPADVHPVLASLLGLVRDVHAPCATDGCGSVDDYDASDPAMSGWARLEVAGIEGEARWYCSPRCVSAALARAGEELAVIEELDEAGAEAPIPFVDTAREDVAADLDARYGAGASDEYALQVAEATEAGFEDERGDGSW